VLQALCVTNRLEIDVNKIIELIQKDQFRFELLAYVSSLDLPDCYIAAGFVRNMVWDYLHGFSPTALNDVDVIYFSNMTINESAVLKVLCLKFPTVNWQLKNQAFMHERNSDPLYENSIHAMSYWPEIETAIGVKLSCDGKIIVVSPFDIDSIFNGFITHNPKREKSVFLSRAEEKKWLELWPNLKIRL